ncbi:hypothetical protein L210DRAFT_3523065 [Boletus edulis BED1]|uniref:Uncharacterized protein n=1 Tax=Boletus edulis BED1 TaxID=1328754 RepID=A0AAD4C5S3_BOLED|nr:hypothetical protein L210DRAFT_3523065 [Boletus edulis BED1]
MATYSSFFSSGLLAPRVARCTTPVLPSSPMAVSASPLDPVDRRLSLTPTPPGQTSPCAKVPTVPANAERHRMRRRRSSINIGASPMALIKSPVRNAGAALQRTGLMSPTRHRAASIGINEAFENNSLFGRLRSGSVGGMANPPKRLFRKIPRPIPIAPPPSAPLPALPISPTARCGSSLLPPTILAPVPRQPLSTRSLRTDNVVNLFSPTLSSPTLLGPGCAPKIPFTLSSGPTESREVTIDEDMKED